MKLAMAATKNLPYLMLTASNATSTYNSPKKNEHSKEGKEKDVLVERLTNNERSSSHDEL